MKRAKTADFIPGIVDNLTHDQCDKGEVNKQAEIKDKKQCNSYDLRPKELSYSKVMCMFVEGGLKIC